MGRSDRVGVGLSTNRDALQAGRSAARSALRRAESEACDFALVFATNNYDQAALLEGVRSAVGDAVVAGCSSAGGVTSAQSQAEVRHEVGVLTWASERLRFKVLSLPAGGKDAQTQVRQMVAASSTAPCAVLLFADEAGPGLGDVVSILVSELSPKTALFGAVAADNARRSQTFLSSDGQVLSTGVSLVVLEGEATVWSGVARSALPVGRSCSVTRAQGNLLWEVNGRPAFEFLAEHVDRELLRAQDSPVYEAGLSVTRAGAPGATSHAILGWDAERGSVRLSTQVEVGDEVRVAVMDEQGWLEELEALEPEFGAFCAEQAPALVLRSEFAGQRACVRQSLQHDHFRRLQRAAGQNVPWIGLYGCLELAGVPGAVHKQSFSTVITAIR